MYRPIRTPTTPPIEKKTTAETRLTISLQKRRFHPDNFLALVPGNAATIRALDTNANTDPITPPEAAPTPAPIATKGAKNVRIPTAAREPITPSTPNIRATQGVIFTITSFQFFGSGGSLEYHSSTMFTN